MEISNQEYSRLVQARVKPSPLWRDVAWAFGVGGAICVLGQLIREGRTQVKVLPSHDKWYGVTYREDKPSVVAALAEKTARGEYPENLWGV